MALRRNGTVLMLIAILFWTAAPAFVCLSDGGAHVQDDCCAAMLHDCDAAMTSSCCQLSPRNNTPAAPSEYSPEHAQQAGLLWEASSFQSLTDTGEGQLALRSLPVPDPSPGRLSVLRI